MERSRFANFLEQVKDADAVRRNETRLNMFMDSIFVDTCEEMARVCVLLADRFSESGANIEGVVNYVLEKGAKLVVHHNPEDMCIHVICIQALGNDVPEFLMDQTVSELRQDYIYAFNRFFFGLNDFKDEAIVKQMECIYHAFEENGRKPRYVVFSVNKKGVNFENEEDIPGPGKECSREI